MSRAWMVLAAVVVMLVVSGWRLGLDDDEEIQLTALLGKPLLEGASAPWNLYDFGHVRDDPETEVKQKAALVYRGDVKWCQNPLPFRVFFFRPLSSVFLWLEFQAFGLHLRPYHLLRILLFVAACLLAAAVFNRVLAASGATPLPVPLVAALLAANPLNQELLARICTVHYLLAAILGFGAYLILLTSEIRPLLRGGLVVALGAASLLAGEAAFQVHAIGSCAMVVCARTMRREQRIVWALLLIAVLLYFIWYRQRPFDAAGYGYTGFGDTSQWVSLRKGKMLDAGLDLFAGTFLTRVRRWAGFLAFGGSKALVTSVILSVAFLAVVALHLVRVPRTRKLAAALLAGAAISSLPVAAVAQTQMRVVALPALPLQFLLCVMARDAWRELRAGAQAGSFMAWLREPRGAMAGFVVAYVCLRLAADVALTPVAIREVSVRSRLGAARWLGDFGISDAHADSAPAASTAAPEGDANVLVVSGTTGVPYPFGAALLARNGFAPRVDGWLFLSDLREGEVQMEREEDNSFKVSPTPKAMLYSRRHFNLYPLASRCGAMRWATYQTRMAVMIIREASLDGNPLEIQLAFRPGVTPKFWSLRDGRIVPVEPPGVGEVKVY